MNKNSYIVSVGCKTSETHNNSLSIDLWEDEDLDGH